MKKGFKKRLLYFILLLSPACLLSQKNTEIGISTGASWYLGDINVATPFYSVSPAFGGVIIHNLNKRLAIRGEINYFSLQANDMDFDNSFQQARNLSFQSKILNIAGLYEFNYRPFSATNRVKAISTYLNGGLGMDYVISALGYGGGQKIRVVLPLGAGIKLGLNRRTTFGIEYSLHKSFSDNMDGISNYQGKAIPFFNNDWYTLGNAWITYKLFDNPGDCPVYEEY